MAASVLYTNFGGMLVHEDRGGVHRTYAHDEMGNTSYLLDANGITDSYEYTPYGTMRSHTGSSVTPFTFIGALGYFSTGLSHLTQYVRARWYLAKSGNWGSVDPLWPGEPAYGYVTGNPAMWSDASGLRTIFLPPPQYIPIIAGLLSGLAALIMAYLVEIMIALLVILLVYVLYLCLCLTLVLLVHPVCDGLGGACKGNDSCASLLRNLGAAILCYLLRAFTGRKCPDFSGKGVDHEPPIAEARNRIAKCLTLALKNCGIITLLKWIADLKRRLGNLIP